MIKLEKLYSIIENSREVGVKLSKDVLQQVEELEDYFWDRRASCFRCSFVPLSMEFKSKQITVGGSSQTTTT